MKSLDLGFVDFFNLPRSCGEDEEVWGLAWGCMAPNFYGGGVLVLCPASLKPHPMDWTTLYTTT